MASPKRKSTVLFGKPIAEYLAFQKVPLLIVASIGHARLLLSLAGLSNETVTWLSLTAAGWIAVLYYALAVHRTGFGGYRHLLPLVTFQVVLVQAISVLAILLAIAGLPNIYAAPQYGGPLGEADPFVHLLAHMTIGIVAPILLSWAAASLVLFVTKRVAPRPAVA